MSRKSLHTSHTPPLRIYGILMVIMLAAGAALSLLNPALIPENGETTKYGELLSGEWAASFQTEYENDLPLKDAGLGIWGSIRFGLFREGLPGVVVGSDGWLFTAEEFTAYPSKEEERERAAELAEYIAAVREKLQAQGVELLVLPVPAKARIYPDKLGRYAFPSTAEVRITAFIEELERLDVPAVDLSKTLSQAKGEGVKVFLRTDTHWTPGGAQQAAAAAAARLQEMPELEDAPSRQFELFIGDSPEETIVHEGDLINFIPLGPFRGRLQPEPDRIPQLELEAGPPPGGGLFDDTAVPIALAGTSYSAGELWGFNAFLQTELQKEVLNMAKEGQGPFDPMITYLQSDTFKEAPPSAVIWEIPERYLPFEELPEIPGL